MGTIESSTSIDVATFARFDEVNNYATAEGIPIGQAVERLVNGGLSHLPGIYVRPRRRLARTVAGVTLVKLNPGDPWRYGRFEFAQDRNAITTVDGTKRDATAGYGMAYYATWSAWDTATDDHAFSGETGYDTLTEAVEWVLANLNAMTR